MNLFNGLHLYEVVLLILGVIFFVALLVMLIISIARGRSIKGLLLFFVIPIVMIGFPAIGKIKFSKDGVEIDKATKDVVQNPLDTAARQRLEMSLRSAQTRLSESPSGSVKLARAQAVLGEQNKALYTLDEALKSDPQLESAKDLKSRLQSVLPSDDGATRKAVIANFAVKTDDQKSDGL